MTAAEVIKEITNIGAVEGKTFTNLQFLDFDGTDFKVNNVVFPEIIFCNCTFEKTIRFANFNFGTNSSIKFIRCTFLDQVNCSHFISKSLYFDNCTFKNQFNLENISCHHGEISLQNCRIGGVFNVDGIECYSLFCSENFMQLCFLNNIKSSFGHFINKNQGSEIMELIFRNNQQADNFKIETSGKINLIRINDIKNLILLGEFKKITIHSQIFGNILFQGISDLGKKSGYIETLFFSDKNFTGALTISDYEIENLDFQNLSSNNGSFSFNNVIIYKTKLENIKVSKIYFDLVEFKNQLIIKTCDLSGLKPNNVTWLPNQVISPDNTNYKISWFYRFRKKKTHDKKQINELKQQRDAYRQLKVASQNNHNQIEALAFYRNEMRLYWKEIRLTGGVSKSNRFLVFLNRWMSDFGQNYWLPLMWIAIFQTLFSVLIWNFEACKHCVEGTTCVNNFWSGLSQYLNWINPIFKAPENWSDGAKTTSFFMRIFNGFFIFHFVKAIRKYGK